YPISAIVGKREWMSLIEEGRVIHAGRMNSSNPTVAAALATIEVLEKEQPYGQLFENGGRLRKGLSEAAKKTGQNLIVQGMGPGVVSGVGDKDATDHRGTLCIDKAKLSQVVAGMHNRGIRIIGRGPWYIGTPHEEEEIARAIL